ncbi:hypothetical protein CJO81_03025 [Ralstonia solanacearum]|uniref:hypothetical protein n=1 Tax=Ralstonia pseudosolanacearum TaxID=1310165 RepID=UPI000E592C06|nr:hypothetical protein [Ralstonia pseudosolanacearum]AXV99822.1 hypothetical protein CJO81_03025 [Ralstonia solanacearum]AXW27312.1 hypothetical protein CJO87_03020 [Ralstonia solanacearum]NJZ69018.1 hypothetical protein [Ralstonia solanacearum]NKF80239.1 hypothetical protein [Ralstonia solanacearum]UYR06923.1 hypothetical protein NQS38_00775 [Ralstonia pseudosolanacearum]
MENTNKKPLSHAQMAKAISIAVIGGAIPVYLAIKGNPWPCVALIGVSWVYLQFRRRQLNK